MKTSILRIVAVLLMLLMVLSACAPVTDNNGDDTTDANPAAGEDTTAEPSTEESTTEKSTTEEPTTEEPTTDDPDDGRPAAKKDMKILMIGNSFCYYFVEELYAMAAADGYDLTVANLYKSGCSVNEHWTKGVQQNKSYYQFFVTTSNGRRETEITKFNDALNYADWDVITLQQHFYPSLAKADANTTAAGMKKDVKNLYNLIRTKHPNAELYWQQTWAYQVGYAEEGQEIPDKATQTTTYNNIKTVSQIIAQENNVKIVPSGDAWQIARADSRVGDNMCARLGTNGDLGDYYHDGDIGGGQYLNACVWYEVLTGESCVGNTWKPSDTLNYSLSDSMIAGIQEAAHAAVAAVYGENYAR